MKTTKRNNEIHTREWWKAPTFGGEEYHTARVWEQIARAAALAGDRARAKQAMEACEFESRQAQ